MPSPTLRAPFLLYTDPSNMDLFETVEDLIRYVEAYDTPATAFDADGRVLVLEASGEKPRWWQFRPWFTVLRITDRVEPEAALAALAELRESREEEGQPVPSPVGDLSLAEELRRWVAIEGYRR